MVENKKISPVDLLFLGACPAVAVSTGVIPAAAMGVAVLAVMLLSTAVMSLIGKGMGAKAAAAAAVIVTACFAAAVQLLMNAFLPGVYSMLGIYIAVIAVDLMIVGTAVNGACVGFGAALGNALKAGILFLCTVVVLGAVREILGAGSICGAELGFMSKLVIPSLKEVYGGLAVYAIELAIINKTGLAANFNIGRPASCAADFACCGKEE